MENLKQSVRAWMPGCSVLFFVLIISLGCATKEAVKSVSDEDMLRERATSYWDLKIKNEFDKSYVFEDPLYRKSVTMITYIQGFRRGTVKWKVARVNSVAIEGDSGTVDMDVQWDLKIPGVKKIERDSLMKEKWVKVDGMWYHIPDRFMEQRSKVN